MNDLRDLITDRLANIDRARERQQHSLQFSYIGEMIPGAYAEPPSYRNVVRTRTCDPLPNNAKFTTPTEYILRLAFEARTVKMGINVWRWREDL